MHTICARAPSRGAALELVTLAPEQAEGIPASIAVRSAATWLLADGLG